MGRPLGMGPMGPCVNLPLVLELGLFFIKNEQASSILRRQKRYNSNRLEEFVPGNLERECKEEKCSFEEAREVFENTEKTMEFWKGYIDGDQCNPNPCKNGARCADDVGSYVCWCLAGYEGRNCELDSTCATKNGGCKHFCTNDPPRKVVCSCAPGYKLNGDGKSCDPAVPFPCGRITAPEAKSKYTRAMNTFDKWYYNSTNDHDEETDNTTQITPIIKQVTRVVGGVESRKGEVPWQVLDVLFLFVIPLNLIALMSFCTQKNFFYMLFEASVTHLKSQTMAERATRSNRREVQKKLLLNGTFSKVFHSILALRRLMYPAMAERAKQ
uniref:Coagulation factor IX n=1 Tax=Gopherus agassizii TaxID=38772 RepID=A0A452I7U7_9SAUR